MCVKCKGYIERPKKKKEYKKREMEGQTEGVDACHMCLDGGIYCCIKKVEPDIPCCIAGGDMEDIDT